MSIREVLGDLYATIDEVLSFRAEVAEEMLKLKKEEERKARRERIATAVLAGFAASGDEDSTREDLALAAVLWADALIAQLDDPKVP